MATSKIEQLGDRKMKISYRVFIQKLKTL